MANVAFGHLFACSGIANSTYYAGIDLGMSLGPIVGGLRSWADSVIGRKARKPAGHAGQVHFSNGARIFNICCL